MDLLLGLAGFQAGPIRSAMGAVASGEYASASEVIREALREWNLRKPLRQAEIERLRKDWQAGMESGPPRPIDFDEIKRRGRERLTRLRATGTG